MKLNTSRTVLVGFAFLSICAFWQMYDNLVPKILTETFGIGESISGVIMASDNVLALFLLPIFGGLSDKCTSKLGRRRPFILFGTLAAVVLMMALPPADRQLPRRSRCLEAGVLRHRPGPAAKGYQKMQGRAMLAPTGPLNLKVYIWYGSTPGSPV